MPTSRPSAPGSISSSDAIATRVRECWLVDSTTGSTIPPLTGTEPALTLQGGPTRSAASPLGFNLTGSASGSAIASKDIGAGQITSIGAYPFSLGTIFCYTGTKTGGSGEETLVALGDATTSNVSAFVRIFISDGTNGTNGHICAIARTTGGGSLVTITGPAFVSGTKQAAAFIAHSAGSVELVVDGTSYGSGTLDAFSGSQFLGTYGILALTHGNNSAITFLPASSQAAVALGWYSVSAITQAQLITWTNDPWTILTQPSSSSAAILESLPVPSISMTGGQILSVSVKLTDTNDSPWQTLLLQRWAFFDQSVPNIFGAPVDTGTSGSTDSGGNFKVNLPHTTLTQGQVGWLIVTNSNGDPNAVHFAFSGPAAVAIG